MTGQLPIARQQLNIREIAKLLSAAEIEADSLRDFILWTLHSGMEKVEIQSLVQCSGVRA